MPLNTCCMLSMVDCKTPVLDHCRHCSQVSHARHSLLAVCHSLTILVFISFSLLMAFIRIAEKNPSANPLPTPPVCLLKKSSSTLPRKISDSLVKISSKKFSQKKSPRKNRGIVPSGIRGLLRIKSIPVNSALLCFLWQIYKV